MLEMKYDSIVDYFLCDGQGLFYFRPSGESYQILYFPQDSYRAYRDQTGELESVVLVYSFNVQQTHGLADNYPSANGKSGKKKWIQLKVYKDRIEQTISDEKIEFVTLTMLEDRYESKCVEMPRRMKRFANFDEFIAAQTYGFSELTENNFIYLTNLIKTLVSHDDS